MGPLQNHLFTVTEETVPNQQISQLEFSPLKLQQFSTLDQHTYQSLNHQLLVPAVKHQVDKGVQVQEWGEAVGKQDKEIKMSYKYQTQKIPYIEQPHIEQKLNNKSHSEEQEKIVSINFGEDEFGGDTPMVEEFNEVNPWSDKSSLKKSVQFPDSFYKAQLFSFDHRIPQTKKTPDTAALIQSLQEIKQKQNQTILQTSTSTQVLKRYMSQLDPKQQLHKKNVDEIRLLEEKLIEAKMVIEDTQQKLKHLNSMASLSENKIHFVFFFASPLVLRQTTSIQDKDTFRVMPSLEFKNEFKEIKRSIQETGKLVRMKESQATIDKFNKIITQNPMALHFSGHGFENNRDNMGRNYAFRQKEGNFLLFETEDGEGELVSEKTLSDIINPSNHNLEFVFVASCHSEFAGKIFLNAGAKHVICVKQDAQVDDQAVIKFSKIFYNSVFSQRVSICDSFRKAQVQVRQQFGEKESRKFSILKQEDKQEVKSKNTGKMPFGMDDIDIEAMLAEAGVGTNVNSKEKNQEHQCTVLGPWREGRAELVDSKLKYNEIPAKVDKYIGRHREIFEVVHNILTCRLVNIIGLPGIGKTSLAKNAVNYLSDRHLFEAGFIFLALKGYMNCEIFLKKLLVNLMVPTLSTEPQFKDQNSEQLLLTALKLLRNQEEELLIVLDNVEDLLYYDKSCFRNLVQEVLNQCPQIRILMTSRTILGALQDVQEKILVLQELSLTHTVELFLQRAKDVREIQDSELEALKMCQMEEQLTVVNKNEQEIKLQELKFFKLLGGNPHAIVLAAPILMKMSLKDLYLLLSSKEMDEVLRVDGISDSTVASLRLSLEASIKVLEKENKESLEFFFMIGLLPAGINEDQLELLWGEDWLLQVQTLLNFSLVQKKEQEKEGGNVCTKYCLPPFMTNYAEAKIPDPLKLLFQNRICHYYSLIIKQIYSINGKAYKRKPKKEVELQHQLMERLLQHETNVYAAIQRMVDSAILKQQSITGEEVFMSNNEENKTNQEDDSTQSRPLERLSTIRRSALKRANTLITKPFSNQLRPSRVEFLNPDKSPQKSKTKHIFDEDPDKNLEFSQIPYLQSQIMDTKPQSPGKGMGNNPEMEDEGLSEDNFSESDVFESNSPGLGMFEKVRKESEKKETREKHLLNQIMRNSIVNFQKPSLIGHTIFTKLKNADPTDFSFPKSLRKDNSFTLTVTKKNTGFNINPCTISKKKPDELHAAEQLVIYYAMNLFLLHENENAMHLMLQLGIKLKGSGVYEGNLKRIMGLICHNKGEVQMAVKHFKEAKKLFKECNSIYGQALCNYSIGFIYRSKIAEFYPEFDEEQIYILSRKYIELALTQFKEVNHIIGQALCHRNLSIIYLKINIKKLCDESSKEQSKLMKLYSQYKFKKQSPHIQRVHGLDLSLMTEIVTSNENKDLFPIRVSKSKERSRSKRPKQNISAGRQQDEKDNQKLEQCSTNARIPKYEQQKTRRQQDQLSLSSPRREEVPLKTNQQPLQGANMTKNTKTVPSELQMVLEVSEIQEDVIERQKMNNKSPRMQNKVEIMLTAKNKTTQFVFGNAESGKSTPQQKRIKSQSNKMTKKANEVIKINQVLNSIEVYSKNKAKTFSQTEESPFNRAKNSVEKISITARKPSRRHLTKDQNAQSDVNKKK